MYDLYDLYDLTHAAGSGVFCILLDLAQSKNTTTILAQGKKLLGTDVIQAQHEMRRTSNEPV